MIGCCYDPDLKQCYHSIPSAYNYIKNGSLYSADFKKTPLFTDPVQLLNLTVLEIDVDRVQIILHNGSISYQQNVINSKNYLVKTGESLLGVEVFRQPTLEMILTTFRGPLIASDGYWEWTFQLTKTHLVGLGEIRFKKNETVKKVIYKNRADHNTLPIFMAYSDGKFHGALVEHEGLLEVTVLPSKVIVLKSLGSLSIKLNLCVGGTNPQDVIDQLRLYDAPTIPYWVLGAHVCRDGPTTLDSAVREYQDFKATENVHFASDCIHENLHFMHNHLTGSPSNLDEIIQDLRKKSRFVLSVTPHVQFGAVFEEASKRNLLYSYRNESLFGSYLGKNVSFPDFTHPAVDDWMKVLNVSFPTSKVDGFVLRDNWPEDEKYEFVNVKRFRYLTQEMKSALSNTIPFEAYTPDFQESIHIDKHNSYGSAQVNAYKKNFDYDFLMTSSYTQGMPEAALIQNVNVSWPSLKRAMITTLYHSLLGGPLISIPICGSTSLFDENLHESLCLRWYLMAATFPLFRISSEIPRRNPSSLGTKYASEIAAGAIQKRMLLLPYYYTSLNQNGLLVKPMFYDFYRDETVWELEEQYMVGRALLVAQPVVADAFEFDVYLPPGEIWYEFWGGRKYENAGWRTFGVLESDWVMFIKQGWIVPLRNTKRSIGSYGPDDTYTLAIALKVNCTDCYSTGQLLLTSGYLNIQANRFTITISNILQAQKDIKCQESEHAWPKVLERAIVYGIRDEAVTYSTFKPFDLCETNLNEITIDILGNG